MGTAKALKCLKSDMRTLLPISILILNFYTFSYKLIQIYFGLRASSLFVSQSTDEL